MWSVCKRADPVNGQIWQSSEKSHLRKNNTIFDEHPVLPLNATRIYWEILLGKVICMRRSVSIYHRGGGNTQIIDAIFFIAT